jgi:cytochrome c peroxidase
MFHSFIQSSTQAVKSSSAKHISRTISSSFAKKAKILGTGAAFTTTYAVVAVQQDKPPAVCPVNHGKGAAPQYKFELQATKSYVNAMKSIEDELRKAILQVAEADENYDGYGSKLPAFVRLGWHASGTYDVTAKNGGSSGGCMRFEPESTHGANNGLNKAREALELVKKNFGDKISYADLYNFAAKVACEEMCDGLNIPFQFGRSDFIKDNHFKIDRIRLPDATQGSDHVRQVFTNQMGFNDQEIVALLGAHAVGKMHHENSGFSSSVEEGLALPWTYAPLTLGNHYYTTLLQEKWLPYENKYNNKTIQY